MSHIPGAGFSELSLARCPTTNQEVVPTNHKIFSTSTCPISTHCCIAKASYYLATAVLLLANRQGMLAGAHQATHCGPNSNLKLIAKLT